MKTIITDNAKAAAMFAQATSSQELGFRQYRGKDYIIVWTDGIPFNKDVTVSETGRIDIALPDEAAAWFNIIKNAVTASDQIIVATDSRDSAFWLLTILSARETYDKLTRIHVREMTVKGVRESFDNKEDMASVCEKMIAGLQRVRVDRYIGKCTDHLVKQACGTDTYKLGRIRTPLLRMVGVRYIQGVGKESKAEYRVHFALEHQGNIFRFASQESWDNPADANKLYIQLKTSGESALITNVKCSKFHIQAPSLFNFESLLKTANERCGLTLEQTVESAKRLYEWGLITYPYGNDKCISFRKVRKIHQLLDFLHNHEKLGVYASRIERLSEGSLRRLPSRGHHGILPTGMNLGHVAHRMSYADKLVYNLICTRLVEAFSQPSTIQIVEADAMIVGHVFTLNETYTLKKGWQAVSDKTVKKEEPIDEALMWPTGSEVRYQAVSITKRNKKTPVSYTEGELLQAAADHKLGTTTEITNAVNDLISEGYLYRSDIGLKPTEKGLALYSIVKDQPIADPLLMSSLEYGIQSGNVADAANDSPVEQQMKVYEWAVSALAESPMLFPKHHLMAN